VESFLGAYPRICQEAAGRLRTLYNPTDYPPVDEVRSHSTFAWQKRVKVPVDSIPEADAWLRDGAGV
jgi:hypothetical protein